jgi:hypothetical protein
MAPLRHRAAPRARRAARGARARFREVARLCYAKVAEFQSRGLVHFHAVIRVDGPGGPGDPTSPAITADVLRDAITAAAQMVVLVTERPDGTPLLLRWGVQVDLREIRAAGAAEIEAEDGSEASLAGYVAKYATKGTGTTEGTDRPIPERDQRLGLPPRQEVGVRR